MQDCLKCGAAIAPEAKFCRACGAPNAAQEMAVCTPFCPSCGRGNAVGAKFCKGCGASLAQGANSPVALTQALVVCAACRSQNKIGARFCKGCGQPLEASVAASVQSEPAAAVEAVAQPTPEPEPRPSPAPLKVEAEAPSQDASACAACGVQNRLGTRFCKGCGQPLVTPDAASAQSAAAPVIEPELAPVGEPKPTGAEAADLGATPTASTGIRILKVVVAILVLAGVAVGSFLFFRDRAADETSNATSTVATGNSTTPQANTSVLVPPSSAQQPSPKQQLQSPANTQPEPFPDDSDDDSDDLMPVKKKPRSGRVGKDGTKETRSGVQEIKRPGQLENDILRQLEEKKRRLGVQ